MNQLSNRPSQSNELIPKFDVKAMESEFWSNLDDNELKTLDLFSEKIGLILDKALPKSKSKIVSVLEDMGMKKVLNMNLEEIKSLPNKEKVLFIDLMLEIIPSGYRERDYLERYRSVLNNPLVPNVAIGFGEDQAFNFARIEWEKTKTKILQSRMAKSVKSNKSQKVAVPNKSVKTKEVASKPFDKTEIVIQAKDEVLRKLEKIDKNIIKFGESKVAKLDNKTKIRILESFGDQTSSSGLYKILEFYKKRLKDNKAPKDTDEVIANLLSMVNNYRITDLKLNSVLDGVLARGTSERGLDFKKNLDVSLGGAAEINNKAWNKTKDFLTGYMDKLEGAPTSVKAVMLAGTAFAALVGYFALTAQNEKTKEAPFLTKVLRVGLIAFGGFAAGNLLSDLNQREAPKDYENLNKYVKSSDYAEFFLQKEPTDSDSRNAGAFIESLYQPRVHQLEFAEVIKTVKDSKVDSLEWINMIDGKGVDVGATHAGIEMFVHRYDPTYTGKESIYKDKEVDDKVKNEMRLLWKKVSIDKTKGDELTYRDVALRFLALDPKFTFKNRRAEGNNRYDQQEKYEEQQSKYKELERISGLDFATGWLERNLNHPALKKYFQGLPFLDEISSVWPDFMGIFHKVQGNVSDIWVNIDEISTQEELDEYIRFSNDQTFSTFKKRISFKPGMSISSGTTISMRQSHKPNGGSLIKDYENAIAVPNREQFFNDFELRDRTGKLINSDSKLLSYITLSPNKPKTDPEKINLPSDVSIKAKRNVEMDKYVLYGHAIKFK